MKKHIFLFFITISTLTFAQQKGFKKMPSKTDGFAFNETNLETVFKAPAECDNMVLFAEDLANVCRYDFSLLTNLESVEIKFTLCPDSSDVYKMFYRDSLNKLFFSLIQFVKCPKLERIVFCIGEQIYLTHDEVADSSRKRQFQRNLDEAWLSFGKVTCRELPGIDLYAYTWGW